MARFVNPVRWWQGFIPEDTILTGDVSVIVIGPAEHAERFIDM